MAKNRRLNDDEGCCNANFLKYLVFIYNFIFYIAGIAILIVGLWTVFLKSNYVVLLATKTYTVAAYLLVAAGLLCILIGVIGCVGLTKDNRRCILTFAFCLLAVFLIEAVAGTLSYVYSDKLDSDLLENFKKILQTSYSIDSDVTAAADMLHKKHGCCGSVDFKDWRLSAWYNKTNLENSPYNTTEDSLKDVYNVGKLLKVPHICCKTINKLTCGERDHPSNIYYDGCLTVLREEIKEHAVILGATALGISAVQIFGIVISCCLYVKLKDVEMETFSRRKKRAYNNY